MRIKDVLLILIIILIGLSINSILKIKELGLPAIMQFGGKANYFKEVKELKFSKGGSIDVQNSYGAIEMIPWDKEVIKIELEKIIYSNDENRARTLAEKIYLTLEQQGEKIMIYTNRDEISLKSINVRTNMQIHAPPDAYTSIKLDHGELGISDMTGNFKIEAEHSEIDMKNIIGNIFINEEYSDLLLESIEGSTNMKLLYGESITQNIHGILTLDMKNSSAEINKILKDARITSSYSDLEVEEINGNFEADCENTELYASNISGDAIIKNTHKDITLRKIGGHLKIESEHCDIDVERVASNATILSEYGEIYFSIPSNMSFSVDLLARNGDIESSFDLLSPIEESRGTSLVGNVGEGGPFYKIETSYNDIHLEKISDQ